MRRVNVNSQLGMASSSVPASVLQSQVCSSLYREAGHTICSTGAPASRCSLWWPLLCGFVQDGESNVCRISQLQHLCLPGWQGEGSNWRTKQPNVHWRTRWSKLDGCWLYPCCFRPWSGIQRLAYSISCTSMWNSWLANWIFRPWSVTCPHQGQCSAAVYSSSTWNRANTSFAGSANSSVVCLHRQRWGSPEHFPVCAAVLDSSLLEAGPWHARNMPHSTRSLLREPRRAVYVNAQFGSSELRPLTWCTWSKCGEKAEDLQHDGSYSKAATGDQRWLVRVCQEYTEGRGTSVRPLNVQWPTGVGSWASISRRHHRFPSASQGCRLYHWLRGRCPTTAGSEVEGAAGSLSVYALSSTPLQLPDQEVRWAIIFFHTATDSHGACAYVDVLVFLCLHWRAWSFALVKRHYCGAPEGSCSVLYVNYNSASVAIIAGNFTRVLQLSNSTTMQLGFLLIVGCRRSPVSFRLVQKSTFAYWHVFRVVMATRSCCRYF